MFEKKCIITLLILFILSCLPCFSADITVRWDANTETDLAGYNLYYKTDTPDSPYDGTGADQGTSPVDIPLSDLDDIHNPEYTLTGFEATHVYFLVLTAYDDAGNESGYSNEVSTFYISSPQNGFYVNSSDYTSFNVSGRGAAGYEVRVYSGGTQVGTTTADVDGAWLVECDFTGVTEGTINISAKTTVIGELTSNIVTGTLDITAPAPPGVPQGLRVDTISESQIDLKWDAVDGVNGYAIYRDNVKLCDIDTNSYNDYDLSPSTTYEYEVASFYDVDNPGEKSELISATTLAAGASTTTSSSSKSSSGCFIGSTEDIEDLLIKIVAGLLILFIFAMAVIGFEFAVLVISKFNSDIKTIITTSSIIIIFVILTGDLVWNGIPIEGIVVVLLFIIGVCGAITKPFVFLKRSFIKC